MLFKSFFLFTLFVYVQSASTNAPHLMNPDISNSTGDGNGMGDGMDSFKKLADSLVPDRSRSGGAAVSDAASTTENPMLKGSGMGADPSMKLGSANASDIGSGIGDGLGSGFGAGNAMDSSMSLNGTDELNGWLNSNATGNDSQDGLSTSGYDSSVVGGSLQGYLDRLNKLAATVQSQLDRGITLLSRVGNQAPSQIPQAAATLQQYLHQLSQSVASLQARINDAASVVTRYGSQSPLPNAANQVQEMIQQLRGFVAQG